MRRLWMGIAACNVAMLSISVWLLAGGETPVQEAMPNEAVQHVARERGMWETIGNFLMKSSWPRLAFVLLVIVAIVYFRWGRRPKKVKEDCDHDD